MVVNRAASGASARGGQKWPAGLSVARHVVYCRYLNKL